MPRTEHVLFYPNDETICWQHEGTEWGRMFESVPMTCSEMLTEMRFPPEPVRYGVVCRCSGSRECDCPCAICADDRS